MGDVTLAEGWESENRGAFTITMSGPSPKGNDISFTYTATPSQGGTPFIYEAVLTRILIEKLGIDPDSEDGMKTLRKVTAFHGLEDLQRRISGGHNTNFDGLPYIKMFSLRDKPGFERFM